MSYFASLGRDIRSVFEHDPAAVIALEVLLAYPGFHARQFHAILHRLRPAAAAVDFARGAFLHRH
jgi:serine acetyltransferase